VNDESTLLVDRQTDDSTMPLATQLRDLQCSSLVILDGQTDRQTDGQTE